MATFKVGMRVRKIAHGNVRDSIRTVPIGAEGVIVGVCIDDPDYEWLVDYDGLKPTAFQHFFARSEMLAPPLPPDEKADAFIAKLKKLGDMPEQVRFVTTEAGVFERKGDKLVKVSK